MAVKISSNNSWDVSLKRIGLVCLFEDVNVSNKAKCLSQAETRAKLCYNLMCICYTSRNNSKKSAKDGFFIAILPPLQSSFLHIIGSCGTLLLSRKIIHSFRAHSNTWSSWRMEYGLLRTLPQYENIATHWRGTALGFIAISVVNLLKLSLHHWKHKLFLKFKTFVWNMLCLNLFLIWLLLRIQENATQNLVGRIVLGFTAGSLASTVNIPFDVAKSRIQGISFTTRQ